MPLDPKCQELLDMLTASGPPSLTGPPVAEARRHFAALAAAVSPGEPVGWTEDRSVPGPAGEIPVRFYGPEAKAAGGAPVLVFFHGGGWVLGSIDTHDALCRALANRARCVTLSVDYRLAPEHPFPAGLDDCYAALSWAAESARGFGGDPARIAVGGDSAGANLAAAVALLARDRGGPRLVHQVLLYPVTDARCDAPSHRDNAEGYLLTHADVRWFWAQYLPNAARGEDPLASPLRAPDLAGLPPATIVTAEYDPLRDEGEAYGARLAAAGVPARVARYDGVVHGFVSLAELLDPGRQALELAASAMRAAFGAPAG